MKSGPTPAFVLARVCAPAAQAWLPVCDTGSGADWPPGVVVVTASLGERQRGQRRVLD
jgi:hypothetical protein